MTHEDKVTLIMEAMQRFHPVYYVETGTGDGKILHDIAAQQPCKQYHTIDINRTTSQRAYIHYHHLPGTHFWSGDSAQRLTPVIKRLQKPILFWLAAHRGDPRHNGGLPGKSPVLDELRIIGDHIMADKHIILIDGMDIYDKGGPRYRKYTKTKAIKELVETIWPNRQWVVEDDIARIYPEES